MRPEVIRAKRDLVRVEPPHVEQSKSQPRGGRRGTIGGVVASTRMGRVTSR